VADPGFAVDSAISLISLSGGTDRWLLTSTPDFLTPGNSTSNLGGSDGYWGANVFLGTPSFAAPEPSTWAMMAMGFAALGFAGYRKARTAQAA
jgi:hypothetical protein